VKLWLPLSIAFCEDLDLPALAFGHVGIPKIQSYRADLRYGFSETLVILKRCTEVVPVPLMGPKCPGNVSMYAEGQLIRKAAMLFGSEKEEIRTIRIDINTIAETYKTRQ